MNNSIKSNRSLFTLFALLLLSSFGCFYNGAFPVSDASQLWVMIFICLSGGIIMFYLLAVKPSLPNFWIAFGLAARICWLFLHRELVAFSGFLSTFYDSDAGAYSSIASTYITQSFAFIRHGLGAYPSILARFYFVLGQNRLLGGWSNILLYIATAIYMKKIMELLGINERGQAWGILFYSVMPFSIMYSVGTFRESVLILPLVMSAYYFFIWLRGGGWGNAVVAVACILFSCYIHAGVAPAFVIYVLTFIFYNRSNRKWRISFPAVLLFVMFLVSIVFMPESIQMVIFNKISRYRNVDVLLYWFSISEGGSAYLEWIDLKSLYELIWFIPLKYFYFWMSPVPWEWRGLQDAVTFLMDSSVYVLMHFIGFMYLKKKRVLSAEWIILALLVVGIGVTYGCGTFSAGTAIRHRFKILPLASIFAVFSIPIFRTDRAFINLPSKLGKLANKYFL